MTPTLPGTPCARCGKLLAPGVIFCAACGNHNSGVVEEKLARSALEMGRDKRSTLRLMTWYERILLTFSGWF